MTEYIFFFLSFSKVENVFGSMMASEDTLFSQKKINANVKGLKKILESYPKKNSPTKDPLWTSLAPDSKISCNIHTY